MGGRLSPQSSVLANFALETGAIEDAVRWADQARTRNEKATDKDNKDFINFIRGEVDSWKK